MKKFLAVLLIINFGFIFADTAAQTGQELLSAQNNYQAAQDKYDASKKAYSDAQEAYSKAKKQLADAKAELEQRNKDVSTTKLNVEKETKNFIKAKNILDNAWNKANTPIQDSTD